MTEVEQQLLGEGDIELRSEAPKGTQSCLLHKGDVLWLPPRVQYGVHAAKF